MPFRSFTTPPLSSISGVACVLAQAGIFISLALLLGCSNHPSSAPPAECAEHADCDDGNICNGLESCVLGQCGSGAAPEAGSICSPEDGTGICIAESCAPSLCGDGFLDSRIEVCDDGNLTPGDGCDADCSFSCESDAECDDGDPCNGTETCGGESGQRCVPGALPEGVVSCGPGLICGAGACVETGCGNGVVEAGEFCDDGNARSGDGCEFNCRFTCNVDSDCDDGNACNGLEVCDPTTNACVAGTRPNCASALTPESACEEAVCDPAVGCVLQLIDHDGDGFAAMELGACGLDCDDTNSTRYPEAPEIRDTLDNDCNGAVDDSMPAWYADCDGDGFAAEGAEALLTDAPEARPSICPAPRRGTLDRAAWTLVAPTGSDIDCGDNNPNVSPVASFRPYIQNFEASVELRFDLNCNGLVEFEEIPTGVDSTRSCWFDGESCRGIEGWVDEEAPSTCSTVAGSPFGGAFAQTFPYSRCAMSDDGVCNRVAGLRPNACR